MTCFLVKNHESANLRLYKKYEKNNFNLDAVNGLF